MFGSVILEIAISMVFIYVLLSMICSAINELIMRVLAMRAGLLWNGMKGILSDEHLRNAFFDHPLIKGLESQDYWKIVTWIPFSGFFRGAYEELSKRPAYIPSRTFALVIQDLARGNGKEKPPQAPATGEGTIDYTKAAEAAERLLQAFKLDAPQLPKNLEKWFDDAMEHVTGWYKRQVHTVNLLLGLTLACVLNADTIMLTQFLWANPAVREKIAEAAEEELKKEDKQAKTDSVEKIKKLQAQLQSLSVPVGWRGWPDSTNPDVRSLPDPHDAAAWLSKIAGLALTGFAVSMGAPFWFDLLKSLNSMRTTGKPPPTAEEREQGKQ